MSFRLRITAATILAALVGACASSGNRATASGDNCALRPQDSTFAAHVPLYRDCAVQRRARQVNTGVHPDFRPTNKSGCYSAEVEFVVSSTGTPDETTMRVLHTNTPAFADAVLAVIPRLRYEPAQLDGSPVAQIVAQKFELITGVVVVPAGQRPTAPRPGPGC